MSAITTNPFASSGPAGAAPFDFERHGETLAAALRPSYGVPFDGVATQTPRAPFDDAPFGRGYANAQVALGQSQFMAIVTQLLGSVSSLLARLGDMLGDGRSGAAPSSENETFFKRATAGSVGDPHESFHAIVPSGAGVDRTWDSMTSHDNLLASRSFDGGYRIASTVTAPSPSGVTTNDRVSVTTAGGNAHVTMNKDGSYDVVAYGRNVALETERAVAVAGGETVMKNADGSLTVRDTNDRGGYIETTLRSNGSGVDVTSTAENVALGGYLVDRHDGDLSPIASGVAPFEPPGFPPPDVHDRQMHLLGGRAFDSDIAR
ncbi:MAG: hypothetical protein NVS4B5_06070 [Vulcanimicrobiaceae bacterium]